MVHRVLVVEDEPSIAEAVELVLREEGYDVVVAMSHLDALGQIDAHGFAFILADLFRGSGPDALRRDPLSSAQELLQHASPTPVGVMTAWPVRDSDALAQGFACLVHKPFELADLLACVAKGIHTPLSPQEEQWAAAVYTFFAALAAGDMATLEQLCTEDVRFMTLQSANTVLVIEGRSGYSAHVAARRAGLQNLRFEAVHVYALPRRTAARYELRWTSADGAEHSESGSTLFRFDADGRISQIGVDYNPERHRQLMGAWSGGQDATADTNGPH
jgi:CheY-like chemotaxis protein